MNPFLIAGIALAVGIAAGNVAGRAQCAANYERGLKDTAIEAAEILRDDAKAQREAGIASRRALANRDAEIRRMLQQAEQMDVSDGRLCFNGNDGIELLNFYTEIFADRLHAGRELDGA